MDSVIKFLREKHRYTQVHLAEVLGISRQALIKYENQEQEPPVSIVRTLAKLFGVGYDCIIDNKLPCEADAQDKEKLSIIEKSFPLLREEEKQAVTEMIRIMANSK